MSHVKFGMGINSLGVSCEVRIGYFKTMASMPIIFNPNGENFVEQCLKFNELVDSNS